MLSDELIFGTVLKRYKPEVQKQDPIIEGLLVVVLGKPSPLLRLPSKPEVEETDQGSDKEGKRTIFANE